MPSAAVSDQTALLTSAGWTYAGSLDGSAMIVGIDRRGRPCLQEVQLELGAPEAIAFLGSRGALGWLSASTNVLDSTGHARNLKSVVLESSIGNLHFEHFTRLSDQLGLPSNPSLVVSSLTAGAPFHVDGRFALRSRSGPSQARNAAIPTRALRPVDCAHVRYLLIDVDGILAEISADWARAVSTIAHTWLYNEEDDQHGLTVSHSLFGIWCVSAYEALGRHLELRFDTLQYTSSCYFSVAEGSRNPVQRGMCAYLGESRPAIQISWSSPGWTPVASGFLLAPT